ncbi:flippase [Acinetobacter towneri]|uniref:flippase n=1 Tax=Acinetobacter towneri TaxID=202956 RepID=UPI0034D53C67
MLKLVSTTFFRQIFAGLCQIITLIIIARTLNAVGMGQYTLAILIPSLLSQVLSFGLQSANIFSIGRNKVKEAEVLYVNLLSLLIISIIGTIGCYIFISFYANWAFPQVPLDLLYLATFSLIPLTFTTVLPSILQATQKFNIFNIICILQPALLLLVTGGVIIFYSDILSILYAYTFTNFITFFIIVIVLLKNIKIKTYSLIEFYKEFMGYSVKSHLSNIVTLLNYRSSLFILGFFTSPALVGIYTVALQLVEKLWLPSQAVSTIFLPRITHNLNQGNSKDLAKSTIDIARITLFFTLLLGFIFSLFLPILINLFFGVEYTQSIVVALLLLPGILAWTPSRILANDLAARGLANINLKNACCVLFINIILSLLFIPLWGFKGAAIATSIAYFSDFLLRAYAFNKVTGVKVIRNLIPQSTDLQVVKNSIKGLRNAN